MQRKQSVTGESFNAATALEDLRSRVVQIEALANAADKATENLPFLADLGARRPISRVLALVEATARATRAALDEADAMVAHLRRSDRAA